MQPSARCCKSTARLSEVQLSFLAVLAALGFSAGRRKRHAGRVWSPGRSLRSLVAVAASSRPSSSLSLHSVSPLASCFLGLRPLGYRRSTGTAATRKPR